MKESKLGPGDPSWIGGLLVAIGAMKEWQSLDIVVAQQDGDARSFTEIAAELDSIDDAAVSRFVRVSYRSTRG